MSEEVKIVINLKGHTASIGVQKPDCDPAFSRVEGDLPAVLETIPGLVAEAQRNWQSSPRNPECETPLSPPPPPTTQRSSASQPPMF